MKKSLVYLLTGMLMLGVAACGKDGNGGQGSSSVQNSSDMQSSSGGQDNSSESQDNSSDLATDDVSGGSAEGQPGTEDGWSEEMEGLKAAAVEVLGDNYWPNMALDAEMLEAAFGITGEMYEDYLAEMPMMSAHVDTFVVVKAKADQVDAVKSALNTYRDVQISNTMQYPMNLGKVQASYVEQIGDYVLFVQLGGDDTEAMDKSEEAAITFCQDANQQVIDAIKQKLGQ